jgi:EAL domain-containing protein (putative c-di-GMP-specific phosphodiesterase class I)
VLEAMRAPFVVNGRAVSVGASVGIAYADDAAAARPERRQADGRAEPSALAGAPLPGAVAADALLRNADLALYAAKARGRLRHATYAPGMHADALARLELEGELRSAVAALAGHAGPGGQPGGFFLAYQPIVDLEGGEARGFEALLRWHPPGLAPVSPAQVVPLAEETGLIVPLGRWALAEACQQLAAWDALDGTAAAGRARYVAVNVSGRQLQEAGFVDDVRAALAGAGLAPGRLLLEITESVMMEDAQAARARLAELKAEGVRVAIDDFGTGYSSLAYLRDFPVDVLKIDKSFVDGVALGGDGAALATAVVTIGQALSLTTVAEGIEDAAQLARLRALGCARGQGYYFARPLPPADVPGWLAGRAGAPAPRADAPRADAPRADAPRPGAGRRAARRAA